MNQSIIQSNDKYMPYNSLSLKEKIKQETYSRAVLLCEEKVSSTY